ncbi:MAG: hypothetical protein ACI9CF_001877 [Candidatus Omnitrophota bacterium]
MCNQCSSFEEIKMKKKINLHKPFKSLFLGILVLTLAFCASDALAFSDDISRALEDNIEFKNQVEDQNIYWDDGIRTPASQITLSQAGGMNVMDLKQS